MLKKDSASPAMLNDAIFIKSVIDAKENREVAIVDLPGAFLHADNDQDVIMFVKGRLAKLMTLIAQQTHQNYVMIEKGEKVLYVRVKKALYGMLKSALLFYKKLRKDLESAGFEINQYYPYVANKMINGNQMTIVWHVDDLNISHQDG